MSMIPTPRFDPVVVVGASTSGLHTACLLASAGQRVLVCERETAEPAARTLILTEAIARYLGELPAEVVLNRTHTIRLHSPAHSVDVRLKAPDLIVERRLLLRWLAGRAEAAGVEVRRGWRFVSLEPEPGGLCLHLEETGGGSTLRLCSPVLVGADGVASSVGAALQMIPQRRLALVQAQVALPAGSDPDVTEVWFDPHITPYFCWCVPEAAERAVVGLIGVEMASTRAALDAFLAAQGYQPLAYQAALVPDDDPALPVETCLGSGRVLLVGDAAAQVKVSTVGGVVTGLWGAAAAARAVRCHTSYRREVAGLRRELHWHARVRRVLDGFSAADYDTLLRLVSPRVVRILSQHTRDDIGRVLLPCLTVQPGFLGLAVRVLLRHACRPSLVP